MIRYFTVSRKFLDLYHSPALQPQPQLFSSLQPPPPSSPLPSLPPPKLTACPPSPLQPWLQLLSSQQPLQPCPLPCKHPVSGNLLEGSTQDCLSLLF